MAGNRQLDDLCALYAEKSEPELLALYAQHEDLTDVAQEALQQVMRERRISPPVQPVSAAETIDEEPNDGDVKAMRIDLEEDETVVPWIDDPIRMNEAIRLLTEAEIPFRAAHYGERESGSGRSYRVQSVLGLVVKKKDEAAATELLQKKMNLAPWLAEADVAEDLESWIVLGIYSRNEAARLATALGAAAVSYAWNDGRDDTSLDESEVRIEVHMKRWDEAHALAEQALSTAS